MMPTHEGEVHIITVKVDHVEIGRISEHEFEQADVMRERFADVRVAPQRARAACHQPGSRLRVAAGIQCHFVSKGYKLLRKIRNDPFTTAV
jgi:hypothetical protein